MGLWGGYGLETVLIRTVIEEWNMGCDYVIEMDCLVIILIQQNYCRSHVNCSREHSFLKGVFPPASQLITALLKWETAFPVLRVRDKCPFSLARNASVPSGFLLAQLPAAATRVLLYGHWPCTALLPCSPPWLPCLLCGWFLCNAVVFCGFLSEAKVLPSSAVAQASASLCPPAPHWRGTLVCWAPLLHSFRKLQVVVLPNPFCKPCAGFCN